MTDHIRHADLFGPRQAKYDALHELTVNGVEWTALSPSSPHYLFMPQDQALRAEWDSGWPITDAMPVSCLGFQSHRDAFSVDVAESTLRGRITYFCDAAARDVDVAATLGLKDTGTWSVAEARKELRNGGLTSIRRCLYRPFDERYVCYHDAAVERRLYAVLRHLCEPNVALVTVRQTNAPSWHHALVADAPVPAVFVEVKDGASVFPLWLYPESGALDARDKPQPNLTGGFVSVCSDLIGDSPAPEDLFAYVYAVFNTPTYGERYAPFLRTEFPRIPLPIDAECFGALAEVGAELILLHLLDSPELANPGVGFPVPGSHEVKKMRPADRYIPPQPEGAPGRVRLNDKEYFDDVPPEAWEFRVGGYQPAAKWLEDRAGRLLTEDDIQHYRRMIAAMRETVKLLPEADSWFRKMLGL